MATRKLDPEERRLRLEERRFALDQKDRELRARDKLVEKQRARALRLSVQNALRKPLRPVSAKQTSSERVAELSHAFFGAALEVIRARLEEGNLQAAIFVATRHLDAVDGRLLSPIPVAANATPIEVGRAILNEVALGNIGIEAGRKMMQMTEAFANLHLGAELEDLREMLAKLGGDAKLIDSKTQPVSPTWLRLQAQGPMTMAQSMNGAKKGNGHG